MSKPLDAPIWSSRASLLRSSGETRWAVDHRYRRPYWGIRSAVEGYSAEDRARLLLPRLPAGAFYSHTTAAQLWTLPLPYRLSSDVRPHVSVPAGRRAMDTRDAIGHQVRVDPADVTTRNGLALSAPHRVWVELSDRLTLAELVAVGDAILSAGLAIGDDLGRATARSGFRGRRTALAAIGMLDSRAESAPESMLRVALISAGVTGLLVNEPVYDEAGQFVARPDLLLADRKIAIEYDGDGHRSDPAQWRKDVRRYAAMEELGLSVIRAIGDDLPDFPRVVRLVKRRLGHAA